MEFKLTDQKRESIKQINIDPKSISYDMSHFIANMFNISITQAVNDVKDGNILVTPNKSVFSDFLFVEWSNALGLKPKGSDKLKNMLWYDFIFIAESSYILRYKEDDVIYHIFSAQGRQEVEEWHQKDYKI